MSGQTKMLTAGPFTVLYENGFLRYIKSGGNEIVRMIYFALRDENWGTCEYNIENEQITVSDNTFQIQYDCFHRKQGVEVLHWEVLISGSSSGEIVFEIEGLVMQDILKNRAGFCILHPIKECAGQPVTIGHVDGSVSELIFPENIAPDDPFKEIKTMRWKVADDHFALTFYGDVFETEDQRNWTDASYKTFCTPLRKPFPVQLRKGDLIQQKVVFKPLDEISSNENLSVDKIELRISNNELPFPSIGVADVQGVLDENIATKIKALGLDHLRVDVDQSDTQWEENFLSASERATKLNVSLSIVLHLSGNFKDEIKRFLQTVEEQNMQLQNVLLLCNTYLTTQQHVIDLVAQIKKELPGVLIGGGTDYNFTELNRNRFIPKELDFVSYSVFPQAHAVDDRSVIEALEGQRDTAISAKILYPTQQVHISPVAFRARFNPYASDENEKVRSVESQTDIRQLTSFGALWTLGSIKQLTEGGASSITYYKTLGKLGLVSTGGTTFPIYEAMEKLLSLRTEVVLSSLSSHPLVVDGIFFHNRKGLVWNYTPEPRVLELAGKKIALEPYAITEVSGW